MTCGDLFLGVLAILFPPIAVWIKRGLCSCDSLINILLCALAYFPGLIHAWYIIAKYPERDYDQYQQVDGGERGERVTYYYVSHQQGGNNNSNRQYGTQGRPAPQQQQPKKPAPMAPPPRPQGSAGPSEGEASSGAPPPSYSDVVKGDHKVQSQD